MQKMAGFIFAFYLLGFISPGLPYVDYYLRQDYIAEFLCEKKEEKISMCYGKCYLEKEIEKSSQQWDNFLISISSKKSVEESPSFETLLPDRFYYLQSINLSVYIYPHYSYPLIDGIDHPPTV